MSFAFAIQKLLEWKRQQGGNKILAMWGLSFSVCTNGVAPRSQNEQNCFPSDNYQTYVCPTNSQALFVFTLNYNFQKIKC